jgi:hypothetical protein
MSGALLIAEASALRAVLSSLPGGLAADTREHACDVRRKAWLIPAPSQNMRTYIFCYILVTTAAKAGIHAGQEKLNLCPSVVAAGKCSMKHHPAGISKQDLARFESGGILSVDRITAPCT